MCPWAEQRKSPLQRATYEYLRGKILDVFPDYWKEAEDHLSKVVKLNPSLADAWLCLANCIGKKGLRSIFSKELLHSCIKQGS
nr:tetratricopeptide repeat protein 5 [Quercus suber]